MVPDVRGVVAGGAVSRKRTGLAERGIVVQAPDIGDLYRRTVEQSCARGDLTTLFVPIHLDEVAVVIVQIRPRGKSQFNVRDIRITTADGQSFYLGNAVMVIEGGKS